MSVHTMTKQYIYTYIVPICFKTKSSRGVSKTLPGALCLSVSLPTLLLIRLYIYVLVYFKIRDSGIVVVETLCMYYYSNNNLIETYRMPFNGFKGVCNKNIIKSNKQI